MERETEHIVYFENGDLFKSFLNSNWYDTPTPYQFCTAELKEIKNTLKSGHKLRIVSNDETHLISSLDDFRFWIKNIFGGGFEEYVFMT